MTVPFKWNSLLTDSKDNRKYIWSRQMAWIIEILIAFHVFTITDSTSNAPVFKYIKRIEVDVDAQSMIELPRSLTETEYDTRTDVYVVLLVFTNHKFGDLVGVATINTHGLEVFVPHHINSKKFSSIKQRVIDVLLKQWAMNTSYSYIFPKGISGNYWCVWYLYKRIFNQYKGIQSILQSYDNSNRDSELFPLVFMYGKFISECLGYNKSKIYTDFFAHDAKYEITYDVDDLASSLISLFQSCKPTSVTWDKWPLMFQSKVKNTITKWPKDIDTNVWKGLIHISTLPRTFCF